MDLYFLKCLKKKKVNRHFQLCTHVCRQVNLLTFRINCDIMRNATNSKIRVSVSHLTQKMYNCERVMRWANDSSLKSIGHWVQSWGIYILNSFWNCSANGEFRYKLNIVNCFNCLWSDVKQEPWEQLKFLADWLNSVFLGKHWWLNWSVTLLQTKIIQCFSEIKENSLNSLHHFLKFNYLKTLVFTQTVFFLFQGRKLIGICYHVTRCKQKRAL